MIKNSSNRDRERLSNDMLVGFCDCFFLRGVLTMARLPVELDPSFPRGRFLGRVYCASTGAPLASAKIKLQGFRPVLDNFFGIHQIGETDRKVALIFRSSQLAPITHSRPFRDTFLPRPCFRKALPFSLVRQYISTFLLRSWMQPFLKSPSMFRRRPS
jgi:hypothetical protein